jgi:hypothetical protein
MGWFMSGESSQMVERTFQVGDLRAFFQMIGYDGINFTYQDQFMVPKGIIDEKIVMLIHR